MAVIGPSDDGCRTEAARPATLANDVLALAGCQARDPFRRHIAGGVREVVDQLRTG
jgi:hypothetical protein